VIDPPFNWRGGWQIAIRRTTYQGDIPHSQLIKTERIMLKTNGPYARKLFALVSGDGLNKMQYIVLQTSS
jgi:hypothetical protein